MIASAISGISYRYYDFFTTLFKYREYLRQSVARDLNKKYKRSYLGYLWSMLGPLFMIAVLTVIFSKLLPRIENYSVFLFCGLLTWQYFTTTVNGSLNSLRGNMKLIEQVPIPKFLFPMSIACSNLVNLLLTIVSLMLVMWAVGHPMTYTALFFPLLFIPIFLITAGFSLLFAVSEIFFEDTKHLTKIVMSAWYYFTPILYGPELPQIEPLVKWLRFNPLYYPTCQTRDIFYYGKLPALEPYLMSCAFGFAILAFALWIFYRTEDKFIYFA